MDASALLDQPLRTAEFLAIDTETNGLGGDACELTEVGAVLVGGGELHDRWEALVPVRAPLSRGIQRFTGITQAMVDEAPAAEATLPELASLLGGRVLVAHSASFDRRVLRQAFERARLAWPDPPVLCTVALARRLHPLARQRRLVPLAESLGIEVGVAHRALADAETCARVFCALFPRLCAHAPTIADALALLAPQRARRPRAGATDGGGRRRGARRRLPALASLPDEPGVYIVRNAEGQPLYVGKSVAVRTRVRAHFQPSSAEGPWVEQAETVDHETTRSELGALLLEQRLIRRLRPPGNVRHKHADGYVYLRCRLDIPFPVLEVAPAPAAGLGVSVGPLRGRAAAVELLEQLNSLFGLRHCPRALPRRTHPSAYGQMGRCLSPCLGDLDPNLYRRRLDRALELFTGRGDGGAALLAHVDEEMRAAAAAQRFERAAWLRRRRERLAWLLKALGGAAAATHARPRLVLAEHPRGGCWDAFWLVGGRVADWCAAPPDTSLDEMAARTAAALRGGAGLAGPASLTAEQVDEARTVATWLDRNPSPALDLAAPPSRDRLASFLGDAAAQNGSSTTSARTPSPASSVVPGAASRRTSASPIGPRRGETATLVS